MNIRNHFSLAIIFTTRPTTTLALATVFFCSALLPLPGRAQASGLRPLPDSIKEVPAASVPQSRDLPPARISRTALQPDETAATLEFQVTLKMRNFEALQARLADGEILSSAEMEANYWPLSADHEKVLTWLKSLGLTITRTDPNRLAIFVSGTISQLANSFTLSFARVTDDNTEFTSAITAPHVPADIADLIVGINGLQPHIRPRPRVSSAKLQAVTEMSLTSYSPPYVPAQIAKAYDASSLTATGSGQIIGIVGAAFPSTNDLTTFWTKMSIGQTSSNITNVRVGTGPGVNAGASALEEACLDVEWASAMAPAARIRNYGVQELSFTLLDQAYQRIYSDLASYSGMNQISLSYGIGETYASPSQLQTDAQYFANLASAGVTIFVASGDEGSTPDDNGGATGPIQVEYPASDPSVTAVGGTSLTLASSAGSVTSETVWASTGGGTSATFSRPSWQTGTGVTTGTKRLVPDVAMVADPKTGLIIVYNGSYYEMGGTSAGAPIWAGLCALINQTRIAAGGSSLGQLGAKIYPLIGTSSFRDIQNGSNGTYSATTGYDFCTGVGVPSISNLLAAIGEPPTITQQPGSATTTPGGSITFTVTATGNPTAYQWYFGGTALNSATSSSLTLSNVQTTNAGNYYVTIANANGKTTSSTATLTVNTDAITNQTVTVGHAVTLVGSSTGTYQWQVSTDGGTTWTDLSNDTIYGGTSTNTLTITGATSAMSGYRYRYIASDSGSSSTSSGLTLNVTAALVPYPACIGLDGSGNLYVGDSSLNTISKISTAYEVTTLAGTSGSAGSTDAVGAAARFNQPSGLVSSSAGVLYVADTGNATLRRILANATVTTVAGSTSARGNVNATGTAAAFGQPVGLALDTTGNLEVADATNDTIRTVSTSYAVTTLAGLVAQSGSTDGSRTTATFNHPTGVAVNSSNNTVYVADTTNNTIRSISSDGMVTTLAGLAGVSGVQDGTGTAALFNGPTGLALDSTGNIYVADTGNSTIRKVTATGTVTTFAGLSGVAGLKDGIGIGAWFNQPKAIAIDSADNLYVADTGNAAIRSINSAGKVTTLTLIAGKDSVSSSSSSSSGSSTTTTDGASTSVSTNSGGGGGGSLDVLTYAALLTLCLLRIRRAFRPWKLLFRHY